MLTTLNNILEMLTTWRQLTASQPPMHEAFAVGVAIDATNCRRQRAACGERTGCVRHHAVHDGRSLAVLAELGLGSTCMYPPPTRVTECHLRPAAAPSRSRSDLNMHACVVQAYTSKSCLTSSTPTRSPCSKCSAAHHGMHVASSHYCRAGGAV